MFLLKPDLDPASLRLAWHSRKQMPTASILFWITTGQLVRLHKEELDDFFLSVFLSFFLWCMTEEEYQWRVLRCYGKWGCARPRALPRAPDECAQRSLRPAQKKHVSLDARLTARTGALVRTTLDHLSWVVVVVGLGRGLATRRGQGAGDITIRLLRCFIFWKNQMIQSCRLRPIRRICSYRTYLSNNIFY